MVPKSWSDVSCRRLAPSASIRQMTPPSSHEQAPGLEKSLSVTIGTGQTIGAIEPRFGPFAFATKHPSGIMELTGTQAGTAGKWWTIRTSISGNP